MTSQHVLYYCTYYSVSLTCTVHFTYCIYCTLYILYMFPSFFNICSLMLTLYWHLKVHIHLA